MDKHMDDEEDRELDEVVTTPPSTTPMVNNVEDFGRSSARMDNMSTTSMEETVSEAYSDEFLRVDGSGLCGLLERIPLMFKLVFMIVISLVGFMGIGAFLLAIQSVTIHEVRLSNQFQGLSADLGKIIFILQKEREYANQFLAANASDAGTPQIQLDLEDSYGVTDVGVKRLRDKIREYKLSSDSIMKKELTSMNTQLTMLAYWRDSTTRRNATTTTAFTYYNNVVNSMLQLLGRYILKQGKNPTIASYLLFMRMLEMEYQIKSVGVIAGTQKAVTYFRVRAFIKYTGVRDDNLDNWLSTTSPSIVATYNANVKAQTVANLKAFVDYALVDRGATNVVAQPVPNFDLNLWNGNYSDKLHSLELVESFMRNTMANESDNELSKAIGLIIGVIVVIVFFFVLSSIVSVTVAYTIVGPWRRLNMIQEVAISKFVPKGLLKLLNCAKITDVALGLNVEKALTIMTVDIADFSGISRNMKGSQIFEFLNKYLTYVGPVIRKHGGFIHSYNGDGFTALFGEPNRGIKAGVEIQAAIEQFNTSHSSSKPISLGVGMHSANVLIGTVGENERMEGTLLGTHSQVTSKLEKITKKFNTRTLVTKSTITTLSGKVARQLEQRKIGTIVCTDHSGVHQIVDVHELINSTDTLKSSTKQTFEKGVTAFNHGLYSEAIREFESVLSVAPDELASTYSNKSQDLLRSDKHVHSSLTTKSILSDSELIKGFEEFCNKERSSENIGLWKAIEGYKTTDVSQRRTLANSLYETYLSMSGTHTININENMKQRVVDSLNSTAGLGADLFSEIQLELEGLMSDTIKRFKESKIFLEAFVKSSMSPPRPYLDTL
jgi:class 3 adenylate cyclase